jgi:uncharacterized protein (TIGR03086 family)
MGTPQLGVDPLGEFDDTAARQRDGFHGAGALDAVVSHPLGDMPGRRFLSMRVFDITVHSWDLATAVGRTCTLDDALVQHVVDIVTDEVLGMGFGIERRGQAGPGAGPLERLLDLSGRSSEPTGSQRT